MIWRQRPTAQGSFRATEPRPNTAAVPHRWCARGAAPPPPRQRLWPPL